MTEQNIEMRQLQFEERKHDENLALERFRIKVVSVTAAIVLALISTIGAFAVAGIEFLSGNNALEVEEKKNDGIALLENNKEDREFLNTYMEKIIGSDLNYRLEFAELAISMASTESVKIKWQKVKEDTEYRIKNTKQKLDEIITKLTSIDPKSEAERAEIERELQRLDLLLDGGVNIALPPRQPQDIFDIHRFKTFVEGLNLRHISWRDFLVAGASNSTVGSPTHNLNTPPPPSVWQDMGKIARVIDEFRERIGAPIKIQSWYRSPKYNSAIQGSRRSMHIKGIALDFSASKGKPAEWAALLRKMRAEGVFKGGIGVQSAFVHVDAQGTNRDW